jgi:hypothetical protein
MDTFNQNIEHEPVPKDISEEFLSMPWHEFDDYLRSLRKEPALSITIDWKDVPATRRLKAFLESGHGQPRSATIRATDEQYMQELNVFASGVKREKV